MKKLLLSLSLLGILAGWNVRADETSTPAETYQGSIGIGVGYQLCPHRAELPGLDVAFNCSNLQATPRKISLTLQRKPAAKPDWLYYEAPYNETITFQNIKVTVEALVMYAKWDGKVAGFVDGRIITETDGKKSAPVYFRSTGMGGLQKIGYSATLGVPTVYNSQRSEFSPIVALVAM